MQGERAAAGVQDLSALQLPLSLIFWVHKPNTIQVSCKEPPPNGFRAAIWPLLKGNYRLASWCQAICGDGQNRRNKLALIFGENLHDMAIRLAVSELKNIATGLKNLSRNCNRRAKRHLSFLVPFVSFD